MIKMIKNYNSFLNESRIQKEELELDLLLESKMVFDDSFIDVISNINSPLTQHILRLYRDNVDVDINTNYISYNSEIDDKVLFKPDNKVKKLDDNFRMIAQSKFIINEDLEDYLRKEHGAVGKLYKLDGNKNFNNDTKVKVKEIEDQSYLRKSIEDSGYWNRFSVLYEMNDDNLSLISWKEDDIEYFTLGFNKFLYKNSQDIKDSEISVGRFIRALMKKINVEFDDKDIESFVTSYKTIMRVLRNDLERIDEVNGEDIRKWYHEDNNFGKDGQGSLGNSCMRHGYTQGYLDIYTENPDQVSLIVMYSDDTKTLICARALLWDDGSDKFMDRIYSFDTSHEKLFVEYAILKGYSYKDPDSDDLIDKNGDEIYGFQVELDVTDFRSYPYMDTLEYYSPSTGVLSTNDNYRDGLNLRDTEGGPSCEYCNNTGTRRCAACDDGSYECSECDGDGNNRCEDCGGEGDNECYSCEGEGKVEDEDGDEVDCGDCEGSGKRDCEECDGDGTIDCKFCDGEGTTECGECEGSGETECNEC